MNEFRVNELNICVENSRQIPHETDHHAKIESPQRPDRQLRQDRRLWQEVSGNYLMKE